MKKSNNVDNNANIERLVSNALAIELEDAKEAGTLGFMTRAMTLATLPHRSVKSNVFSTKKTVSFTLTIMSPPDVGLPLWNNTEIIVSLDDNRSGTN